jgi:hypothetical protein
MTCDQFDTYIQSLLEELKQLWGLGVVVRNATTFNGEIHYSRSHLIPLHIPFIFEWNVPIPLQWKTFGMGHFEWNVGVE